MGACCKSCEHSGGSCGSALGLPTEAPKWWRIVWGGSPMGWFWGTSSQASELQHGGPAELCEYTGVPGGCLPQGFGDPQRARYWECWRAGKFLGWVHGDAFAANVVEMGTGSYTLVPPGSVAGAPLPPVGRPDDGDAPGDGEHTPPSTVLTPDRRTGAALGIAAGLVGLATLLEVL